MNNSAAAVGATYANGPFSVGAAYTKRKPSVGAVTTTTPPVAGQFQENTHYTVGGAVTFGPARIAAGYARENQDRSNLIGGESVQKNAWLGGSYDITPALGLTAAYYDTKANGFGTTGANNGKRQLFIVGATYALSKRTNFYADVDYAKFKGDLASGTAVTNTTYLTGGSGQLGLASAAGQDKQVGVSVGINHLF
jgi:predicted porin